MLSRPNAVAVSTACGGRELTWLPDPDMSGSSTTPLFLASYLPSYCRSTVSPVVQFTVVVPLLLLNVGLWWPRVDTYEASKLGGNVSEVRPSDISEPDLGPDKGHVILVILLHMMVFRRVENGTLVSRKDGSSVVR